MRRSTDARPVSHRMNLPPRRRTTAVPYHTRLGQKPTHLGANLATQRGRQIPQKSDSLLRDAFLPVFVFRNDTEEPRHALDPTHEHQSALLINRNGINAILHLKRLLPPMKTQLLIVLNLVVEVNVKDSCHV